MLESGPKSRGGEGELDGLNGSGRWVESTWLAIDCTLLAVAPCP